MKAKSMSKDCIEITYENLEWCMKVLAKRISALDYVRSCKLKTSNSDPYKTLLRIDTVSKKSYGISYRFEYKIFELFTDYGLGLPYHQQVHCAFDRGSHLLQWLKKVDLDKATLELKERINKC